MHTCAMIAFFEGDPEHGTFAFRIVVHANKPVMQIDYPFDDSKSKA
jgi:hypothetical protein